MDSWYADVQNTPTNTQKGSSPSHNDPSYPGPDGVEEEISGQHEEYGNEESQHPIRDDDLSVCRKVCMKSFKARRCVCAEGSCPHEHNLNYEKILKGVCFFEFAKKGSCKRGEECWFTHQIPDKLRSDTQMVCMLSQSLSKIQQVRESNQRKKLPVEIRMPDQRNFLLPMQRPQLQGSLPTQTHQWSHPSSAAVQGYQPPWANYANNQWN